VARYGGEEFVIVVPDNDKEKAHAKAVKIRKEIEKYPFKYQDISIKITMSMGVAEYPGDAVARRELIDMADKALYRAKEEGRNRVIRA
jgi:diguanylate cyclase (GGDEF)-like protein